MSVTSYLDDNSILGKAFIERTNNELNTIIQRGKYEYSEDNNDQIYAFSITKNESLSEIYNDNYQVVRLVLKNIDTMHSEEQEKHFKKLFLSLEEYMNDNPAYYNVRIPTHFVDAIKAYNEIFKKDIFCGGTVEWIGSNKKIDIEMKPGINVFWADKEYIEDNKTRLLNIAYTSFEQYQGQYHISPVTAGKAGIIYQKWLENSFDNYQGNVLIVTHENTPISFVLYGETDYSVEAVVGAVDNDYRKYGAYRLMISTGVNYATSKNKNFVTSTQFDNYIVQGVWASLGLKPFYSIYNIHCDRR